MSSLESLVEKHIEDENLSGLDSLCEKISKGTSKKKKEILADAYISYYGQCVYDFMSYKYTEVGQIMELIDIPDKIKL